MKKTRQPTVVRQPLRLQREQIRILDARVLELIAGGVWTTDPSHSGCTSCQVV